MGALVFIELIVRMIFDRSVLMVKQRVFLQMGMTGLFRNKSLADYAA